LRISPLQAIDSRRVLTYGEELAVTLIVLICALGVAILTAAASAVAVWRVRNTADQRVADAVQKLAAGMQETMRDLAQAVDTAQTSRADLFVGELAASLDLDEVTERTLEAVSAIRGVEAALLDAEAPDGARLNATVGMPVEEAAKAAVQLPENDNLRAVEITYRYRIDDVENSSASHVRSGVVLPMRSDGTTVGSLSAFSRSAGQSLGDAQIDELERVAFRAGPALENARKYAEARALADLDALTSLHNRRYFHETLAREVARAQRYGRRLSLIVFDLDDFKAINDRVGHLAGDAVLAEAAERLLSVVRSADIACRVGGDEFAVVLPESNVEEAELLAGRIARAINARPITAAGTVELSAGVAELRSAERPTDLFERADEALYRAKELGKAQTHVAANGG
jgi:diguanylate cyclase (GGDEF)-like protein